MEGTIYQYLSEIHSLLIDGGLYLLCTLHTKDFISPIIESSALQYDVKYYSFSSRISNVGVVAVCKKKNGSVVNEMDLQATEEKYMNAHFKEDYPLLTEAKKDQIRDHFQKYSCNGSNSLPLEEAHRVLFDTDAEYSKLGYSYELFLDDISHFSLQNEGEMHVEEAVVFIMTMQ